MKLVKATKTGFYAKLREPGEVFAVPDDFRSKWAEPVEEADKTLAEVKERTQSELSVDEVLADLELRTDAEVQNMLDTEIAGKKRKGVIAKLTDEIENRAKLLS